MKKRVFRYFFDFLDGQTEWLNQMAAQGWRLARCRQLSYAFESCEPGEYEYAVEFVADRSLSDSKKYKEFLESLGYTVFYKNLSVGAAVGKVRLRPWAKGAGQIATAPGAYFKELLIVEKKKDGTPFALHSDLTDKLSHYRRIRNALLWMLGSICLLATMCLFFAVGWLHNGYTAGALFSLLGLIFCGLFGGMWLKPLQQLTAKIRIWEEEAKTDEYCPPSRAKRVLGVILAFVLMAGMGLGIFWAVAGNGFTVSSGSALVFAGGSGRLHWSGQYQKLSGFRQRSVSLGEGAHTITVDIVSDSGEIGLTITGKSGTVYYSGSNLPTSVFTVPVGGKDRLTLRIDAVNHSGSYTIRWE